MRTADDRAVVRVDHPIAVHIDEPDPTDFSASLTGLRRAGTAGVGFVRGCIRRRGEIPVRHLAIEGTDRRADLVDDRVPNASDLGTAGTREGGELAIDPQDLVPIVAAIERHAPDLTATQGAAVGGREINSPVSHLADVLNCRAGGARGGGSPGVEEQIVGDSGVQVNREIAAAA